MNITSTKSPFSIVTLGVLQLLMKRRRLDFLKRSVKQLPDVHVRNRYHREEYRNKYELLRIWNRCTEDFLKEIDAAAEDFPLLRRYIPHVLLGQQNILQNLTLSLSLPTVLQGETLNAMIEHIKNYSLNMVDTQIDTEERTAASRQERDIEYMRLMLEMLDKVEEMEQQKVEKNS